MRNTSLRLTLPIFCCVSIIFAAESNHEIKYFAGVSFSHNRRHAHHVIDEAKQAQEINREPALLWGVFLGRSYYLGKSFGAQLTYAFDMGRTDEGLLLDEYHIEHHFVRFGFRPSIQFFLPQQAQVRPYLHAGCGVEHVFFREHLYSADRNLEYTDVKNMEAKKISFSLLGGGGAQLLSRKDWKLGVQYWLTYSKPVKATYSKNLPLSSIEYNERFLSQILQLVFHFRLLNG